MKKWALLVLLCYYHHMISTVFDYKEVKHAIKMQINQEFSNYYIVV